jgi:hypothetical protein
MQDLKNVAVCRIPEQVSGELSINNLTSFFVESDVVDLEGSAFCVVNFEHYNFLCVGLAGETKSLHLIDVFSGSIKGSRTVVLNTNGYEWSTSADKVVDLEIIVLVCVKIQFN